MAHMLLDSLNISSNEILSKSRVQTQCLIIDTRDQSVENKHNFMVSRHNRNEEPIGFLI